MTAAPTPEDEGREDQVPARSVPIIAPAPDSAPVTPRPPFDDGPLAPLHALLEARHAEGYRSGVSDGYALGLRAGWLDALDFAFSHTADAMMNPALLDELAEALRGAS